MNNLWRVLLALALLELELLAGAAAAQTVRADRVTLNVGPCTIFSGSATPTGAVVGNICDTYIQTTTGALWTKASGTGTSTGWLAALAGAGTPGTIPQWTGTGASLGDSIISQAAGLVTIAGAGSITGAATIGGLATMNAANVTTTANVGGLATLGAASITGNATIGGTASVTGASTLSGAVTLGSYIGTASYASQVAGWRITAGGAADVRYLYTDELRAKLFTADAESVLAGSLRVTKSYSTVAQPFTCPAASSTSPLWVYDASTYGDAPVFVANDWIVIHVLTRAAFGPFTITDCVGTVSSYVDGTGANAGSQTWTFTRGAGANGGAMTGGTVIPVNQLAQDMGVSGNGYVELSAVDGANGVNAPYIQTNIWTTAPVPASTSTTCRLGNLNGITSGANEYGLVCSRGLLYDPTASSVRLSSTAFQVRNVALDYWNNNAQVLSFDPTAPSLAMGNPIPLAYSGANPAGFWMGKDSDGIYKIRIGDPAGNRLTWNGAGLTIVGNGSGITDINGGNITAGTITGAQINVTPAGAALNDDPNTLSNGSWADVAGHGLRANVTTIPDGAVGTTSLRSPVGHSSYTGLVKAIIVDPQKAYRIHVWARASADASGQFMIQANAFDGAGAYITTYTFLGPVTIASTWTVYNVTPAIAANIRTLQLAMTLNYVGNDLPAGWMEVQDVRFEEALPSTLIKDGAITTNKILAGSITGDRIAANTITVGNLNATGFGDNLVKNSTFEGPAAQALAGWRFDPASAPGGQIYQSCCGTRGPGTLYMDVSGAAGANAQIEYLAAPVQAGLSYRVAFDIYSPGSGAGFYAFLLESNSVSPNVRWVVSSGSAPDVIADSGTTLVNNAGLANGWTHVEVNYIPGAAVHWVSFTILNNTCAAGACTGLHLDAVEMQPQLGSGHIRAASISADRLVANTITAAQIAAGTITSTQIAASTITGGNIAGRTITAGALVANTITSNEIGVRAIVAGNIATGTLTANEIAAGTITGDRIAAGTINANNIQSGSITADRLAVTSLSAISANLGSITAGSLNAVTVTSSTINSPTINAGCTTINANGITLVPGTSNNCNWYKWNTGVGMYHDGGAWQGVTGTSWRVDTPSGASIIIDNNLNLIANSTITLNGYVNVSAGRTLTVSNLSGSGNRLVCTNNNGQLYTSAANGSC